MSNKIDFFISFTQADQQWAEWIAWTLTEAGHRVRFQKWHFRPGMDFVKEIEDGITQAKHTIAILSPQYLNSKFGTAEWRAVWAEDTDGKTRKLIPVLVRECSLKGLLKTRIHINLINKERDVARQILLDGVKDTGIIPIKEPDFPECQAISLENEPPFPGSLPLVWNIPTRRNLNFTGREELLFQLRDNLSKGKHLAALIHTFTGLGGVGKTQLALEYAYRNSYDYDIVWWIRSDEPVILAVDFAALASELDLPEKNLQEESKIIKAVHHWLNHNGKWLLIFDNVKEPKDLKGYLPQAETGHVIVTSRFHHWQDIATEVDVKVWEEGEAITFFLKITGRTDDKDKEKFRIIANTLGYLPLAVAQAAAYIKETGCSLDEYLELLENRQVELWNEEDAPNFYKSTVDITWNITMEAVQKAESRAVDLLNLFAYLAPQHITKDLVRSGKTFYCESFRNTINDHIVFNRIIKLLGRYSMIEVQVETYSLHRVVQAVIRNRLEEKHRPTWAKIATEVVSSVFPPDCIDVINWPRCTELLPHAKAVVKHAQTCGVALVETVNLLNRMGLYSFGRGYYGEAENSYRLALQLIEIQEKKHPELLTNIYINLALSLRDQGRYVEAESMYYKTIQILESLNRGEDQDAATCLTELARLYQEQGEFERAEPLYLRANHIFEKQIGKNNLYVAANLHGLAGLLQELGRYDESESMYRKALMIRKELRGEDHPEIASTLNDLALVLYAKGRYKEAENLCRRALEITERQFGNKHPDVATSLNNVAKMLFEQGKATEAEPLCRRALKMDEELLGKDHWHVSRSLNNLAFVLQDLEKHDEAEQLFRRALEMSDKQFGNDHFNTGIILNNIANLLRVQGKYSEAESLFYKVLEIKEKQLGQDHPSVANSLACLADLFWYQGRFREAEAVLLRAVKIRKEKLGKNHPDTKVVLDNLKKIKEKFK